jgi:hypothetical protein
MRFRTRVVGAGVVMLPLALGVTACKIGGLSGSSTCQDFMNASSDEQYRITTSLAQKYHKPDLATPLGRPEVPYECANNPKETLDQLFSREQD